MESTVSQKDKILDLFNQKRRELCLFPSTKLLKETQDIAKKIPHLHGWPYDPHVFWDFEATMWDKRIDPKYIAAIKELIIKEKKEEEEEEEEEEREQGGSHTINSSTTIEIGCGSTPFFPHSTHTDLSLKMIQHSKKEGVQANATDLPFKSNTFTTCIMSFVINYIKNIPQCIKEIHRVLKKGGQMIIIQSAVDPDNYHSFIQNHKANGFEQLIKKELDKHFHTTLKEKKIDTKRVWTITGKKA